MTEMQTTRSYHITVITSIHHKKNSGAATKPTTGKIGLLYLLHQLCFFSLLQKPNFLAPSFHWRSSSWGSEFQLGSLCLLQKGVWCCVKKGNVFFLFAVVYILPAIILPLTFFLLTACQMRDEEISDQPENVLLLKARLSSTHARKKNT